MSVESLPAWAQRLIELRRARVWSEEDLARELRNLRPDLLGQVRLKSLAHQIKWDWETGKHQPGLRYRPLLAAVYAVEEDKLFNEGIIVPVSRRDLLSSAGAAVGITAVSGGLPWLAPAAPEVHAAQIGTEEVQLLRQAADDLDALDQRFGGDRLWRFARSQLLWIHRLLDMGAYTGQIGQELHSIAGALTTSLGWFCYDAGLQNEARVYFSEALNTAVLTGNEGLATRTLANMSRQAVDLSKGRDAVRFAQTALAKSREWSAPPRVQALLAIREAQGHARLGDTGSCEISLHQAHTAHGRGVTGDDPDWTAFLNEAEMTTLEGMCRIDLGQHKRAVKLLRRACDQRDVEHARNRGMGLGRLAYAAVKDGDLDQACDATHRALTLIDGGMSSTRNTLQLRAIRNELIPHQSSAVVRDTTDRLDAHIA